MTENISSLFHYLKKEKINIDQKEFDFQVQSHSDYPSLLAISDTLSFFKINNLATRIENEDLQYMPDNFIALINNGKQKPFLAFVERNQNEFQYVQDAKPIKITKKVFLEHFQNIVLVAEKEEIEVQENNNKKTLFFALVILGFIYFSSIFTTGFSILTVYIALFASIGVYLSIEAISHEFGIKTKFSVAVCTITTNTDCDAVINSKKPKLLELISFSDSSITFFGAQLLALLFLTISNRLSDFYVITTILLLCGVPITFFSIYQQWFVVKKWCPICLTIIGFMYVELSCLLLLIPISLSVSLAAINYFTLALVGSYFMTVLVKTIIKKNVELQVDITKNNRFKRKYSFFKRALLDSDSVEDKSIPNKLLILGNPEAKLKITMVSSPFCSYCKDAHKIIEDILERYRDKVSITIQFNFDTEFPDEKSLSVHQKLIRLYLERGQDAFVKALHMWFENKNIKQLELAETSVYSDLNINEILNKQYLWNQKNKIIFTPTIIINGYHFPKEYERNDLIYFINDLEDDEDIN